MRKIFTILAALVSLIACEKAEEFKTATFPGYSGSGESASWVVNRYRLTDTVYLKTALAAQTPPTTLTALNNTLNTTAGIETGPYSLRLHKGGEVSVIARIAQNKFEWFKQADLKWEVTGDFMNISKNVSGSWVSIIEAAPEVDKMVCKFKRAYWGDKTASKDLVTMELIYNSFRLF
jgi:hypothetical protein